MTGRSLRWPIATVLASITQISKRKRRMKSSFIAEIYIYRETAPRLGDCTGYSSRVGRRYAQHVDAEKIPVQIIVDGRGECGSNDREHT